MSLGHKKNNLQCQIGRSKEQFYSCNIFFIIPEIGLMTLTIFVIIDKIRQYSLFFFCLPTLKCKIRNTLSITNVLDKSERHSELILVKFYIVHPV